MRGAGVAKRVVDRLVRDAQHGQVPFAVPGRPAVAAQLDLDTVNPFEHLDLLAQRSLKTVALELRRPQPQDQ